MDSFNLLASLIGAILGTTFSVIGFIAIGMAIAGFPEMGWGGIAWAMILTIISGAVAIGSILWIDRYAFES